MKTFVLPTLGINEIKNYIDRNYPTFSIIHLNFEYDKRLNKWRIIVDMKPDSSCSVIASLRSEWMLSPRFFDDYSNLKSFIENIDDLPF